MKFRKSFYIILTLFIAIAFAGCGGNGSHGSTEANYVRLQSDSGDPIGLGKTYTYSQANARISVSATGNHLSIAIDGSEMWMGEFKIPNSLNQLQVGNYSNLQYYGYPFNDEIGGLSWYGEHRGIVTLTGWFAIDKVTYLNGILTEIDLRFEQHSEGASPALHGQIHWTANDTTTPPGPVNPPPAELWQPSPGSTPSVGNYVYLQSDTGDSIGSGQTYTYTQANAQITVTATGGHLSISINDGEMWFGDFQAMFTLNQLTPGYYGYFQGYPFSNPVKGGLSWYGHGSGCNTLTGWFAIDNVNYVNGVLTAIDLRFEQHDGGFLPALHGQIHWTSNDTTTPPGPVNPPPAELWQPSPGSTPSVGNYVYLQNETGDYSGAGQTYTYTKDNAQITVTATGGHLSIRIKEGEMWYGNFQTMFTLNQLTPGYYGNLQEYPFYNPAQGGLSWWGHGSGAPLTGWFVIDNVNYVNGVLSAIDLRFEQHYDGYSQALHGQIHWIQ